MRLRVAARGALRDIVNRSPEIVLTGLVGNGLPVLFLLDHPDWRTWWVFSLWALVSGALVFVSNFRSKKELEGGFEPRAWRTLLALQLLVVGGAWVLFARE